MRGALRKDYVLFWSLKKWMGWVNIENNPLFNFSNQHLAYPHDKSLFSIFLLGQYDNARFHKQINNMELKTNQQAIKKKTLIFFL